MESTARVLRARVGGLTRATRYDGVEVTAAARQAADQRFRDQAAREAVERGDQLTEAQLERRASALRRLHYARMAFESAKVRASKKIAAGSTSAAISNGGARPGATSATD